MLLTLGMSQQQQQQHRFSHVVPQRNVVVLGCAAVGKTALCLRFVNDRFDERYDPTYENSFYKKCQYKGRDFECTIKDTQGLVGRCGVARRLWRFAGSGLLLVLRRESFSPCNINRSYDSIPKQTPSFLSETSNKHH